MVSKVYMDLRNLAGAGTNLLKSIILKLHSGQIGSKNGDSIQNIWLLKSHWWDKRTIAGLGKLCLRKKELAKIKC